MLSLYSYTSSSLTLTAAKSLQSCPTLCDPIDGSLPGSAPGILQARTLEWVAISFSNVWKWKVKWSRSVVSDSWWPHGLQPTRLLHPWDFTGKSTGVRCHCLLQTLTRLTIVDNFTLYINIGSLHCTPENSIMLFSYMSMLFSYIHMLFSYMSTTLQF